MKYNFKIAASLIISAIVCIVSAGIIFKGALNKALPQYSGEVNCKNILSDVEIYRDSVGIPYIIAESDKDAAFALGYLHAQERLFQMDMMRRSAEGELSEIFGSRTVAYDKMFLTVGIKRFALSNLKNLPSEELQLLTAYSNGVNEFIQKNKLPVEFDFLNYVPENWRPEHCLMIMRMMAWDLNISWWTDFTYLKLIKKFGEEKVKEIYPEYSPNAPLILGGLKNLNITGSIAQTDREYRNFMGIEGSHIGSNNWVINSKLSAAGKPIIANDPHLGYSLPGVWYAAVIKSPSWNCSGVTLPGTPVVTIGKNENIAWAMTNIMLDDADFYSEKLDETKSKYFFNNEWHNLNVIKETIKVKDSSDVVFTIKSTHRGPLVDEIHPYNFIYNEKNKVEAVSMRWSGNDFSNELNALYKVNKSSDWSSFKAALSDFSVPGQNFVYADKSGNIGYIFGGKIPRRDNTSQLKIFDGTTDASDWKGYLSYSENPTLLNPTDNFIATANNKTLDNFSSYISNLWEPTSRITRITQLLRSKQIHTLEDIKGYQTDQTSPYALRLRDEIINSFKDIKITDKNLKESIELLKNWDGNLSQYSQAACIYEVFLKLFFENIYANKMDYPLYNDFVLVASLPYRCTEKLLDSPNSDWFDIPKTPYREDKSACIRKSLSDAIDYLEHTLGKEVPYWQWGNLHKVVFKHTFAGVTSFLDYKLNIGPSSIGGDGTTIWNTEYSFASEDKEIPQLAHKPFENYLGQSMRFIADFSQPDLFYLILPAGESGNPISKNYRNLYNLWSSGGYLVVRTDINSIKKNKVLTLVKEK